MKIVQVGVGYWGPNILRNLVASGRCEVPAVVEISGARRNYVKARYPALQVTDDFDRLLRDPEVDAVVICTPVATHFDLAARALRAGKHVLVEKPLTTTSAQVDELGAMASVKRLTVMVSHTFLFNAAVRYVKKLIDAGDLGDVRYIYSQRLNLGRIRSDVDALWNFGPHDISIIQYWLGDPTPISAERRGVSYLQDGVDDVVFLNIMYPGKVMANIHVSWLDPLRIRRTIVVGSARMVVYDDAAENKIALYDKGIDRRAVLGENMDFDNQSFPVFDHRSGDVVLPKIDFQEPLQVEIDHFIDCVEGRTECLTGIQHARRVVSILELADRCRTRVASC